MINLHGKVAMISGSSRGIGRACALRLAEAGADVVLNYVTSKEAARQVAEQIQHMGRRVGVIKADISEQEDVRSALEFVESEFGQLDILVSNAANGGFRPLLRTTGRQFQVAMNTNALALVYLVQAALPLLEQSAGRAKVVAISSHGSHLALPNYGLIGSSKAALESLVRHLTLEVGDRNVNVNCVKAGLVETDSTRRMPGANSFFLRRMNHSMVGERVLRTDDVANAVLFLASPLSDMIQGETIVVDGGTAIQA